MQQRFSSRPWRPELRPYFSPNPVFFNPRKQQHNGEASHYWNSAEITKRLEICWNTVFPKTIHSLSQSWNSGLVVISRLFRSRWHNARLVLLFSIHSAFEMRLAGPDWERFLRLEKIKTVPELEWKQNYFHNLASVERKELLPFTARYCLLNSSCIYHSLPPLGAVVRFSCSTVWAPHAP